MTTSNTPAGRYPDPDGSGGQRFWDGSRWTENHAPSSAPPGVTAEPEPEPAPATVAAPIFEPPPYAPDPPEDARSTLIKQYSIGVGVGLVLVVATAVWALTATPDSNTIQLGSPATSTTSTTATSTATKSETSSAAPTTEPVPVPEDGVTPDITFLITAVDSATSVTSPNNEYLTKEAQGEFIIVTMEVTNTGTQPATYVANLQKLLSAGTAYESDPEATFYLGSPYEELAPGDKINATIVYDVPPGTVPDGIELHGDTIGPGITVPFQ